MAERARWRSASEAELVSAVRQGDFEALREFYARFEPLLARYAARAGLAIEYWEDEAHDVLCDVVLALITGGTRTAVRSVHGYIIRAFRNRMLDARRASRRRDEREIGMSASTSDAGERLVLESCSEHAIRESAGAGAEVAQLSPALSRLARVLDDALSADERRMLEWVSHAVPMREIAGWLDIGYSAAKVRLSRLRSRLRERALRHVNQCAGAERAELVEFFRRSAGGAQPIPPPLNGASRAVEPGGAHGND
jgi:RNA polymerase sigma factor (sigma-70 family)